MAVQLGEQQERQREEDPTNQQQQEEQENEEAGALLQMPRGQLLGTAAGNLKHQHSEVSQHDSLSCSASATLVELEVLGADAACYANEASGDELSSASSYTSSSSSMTVAEVYERYSCTGWSSGALKQPGVQGMGADQTQSTVIDPYTAYGTDTGKIGVEADAAEADQGMPVKAEGEEHSLRQLRWDDLD